MNASAFDLELNIRSDSLVTEAGRAEQAMASLLRTVSGLPGHMNAASASMETSRSSFTRQIATSQQLTATLKGVAISFDDAGEKAKTLSDHLDLADSSLTALTGAMSTIGVEVSPKMVGGLHSALAVTKSIGEVARATGSSFASMGVAAIGVAAALATLSAAWEMMEAKQHEKKVEADTVDTFDLQRKKLKKLIDDLRGQGKLSDQKARSLQLMLELAPNTVEGLQQALKSVQHKLRPIVGVKADPKDLEQLERLNAQTAAQGLSGRERALAELRLEMRDLQERYLDLAQKTGKSVWEFVPSLDTYFGARLKEINERFAAPQPQTEQKKNLVTEPETPAPSLPHVTALEKMGLILNGFNGNSSDHLRDTALNTRLAAKILKDIHGVIVNPPTDSSGPLNH